MQKHPFFNLYLHSTKELESLLKIHIQARTTLHEWPLSYVECLTTARGDKWIYKSQSSPSVEHEFYNHATSTLLISAKTLHVSKTGHSNMLFEYLDAPLLQDCNVSDDEVFRIGQTISKEVSEIEGQLPYYLDVSTATKWTTLVETLLANLTSLTSQGVYKRLDKPMIAHLKTWALSQEVLNSFSNVGSNVGYVHHDLSGSNIFVTSESYRVIDWQRPIFAPKELDVATLLISLGKEPLNYIGQGIVWMMYILQIHWFTECTLLWFPDGYEVYDKSISKLVQQVGQ